MTKMTNYMLNGKATIILLIVGLIKSHRINEGIFSKTEFFRRQCKSWIRLNYVTKVDLKNATGVDTSKFAKKGWFS